MEQYQLESLLKQFADGSMSLADTMSKLMSNEVRAELPPGDSGSPGISPDETVSWNTSLNTDEACVDLGRKARCGFPEVVYGPGKSPETVVQVFETLAGASQPCLATRVNEAQTAAVLARFPEVSVNTTARTLRIPSKECEVLGRVAVVSAGTGDLPVAEETLETVCWMNCEADLIIDVGVAGPQRLVDQVSRIRKADAVVVVAGMEGALPSVVGGHVSVPVFGVPTSVGYGANFGGVSALLSMLNSCAANVAVVNIDAGFKAGYLAGMVARAAARNAK